MPVEEIALGTAIMITLGDGRSIIACTAKETIKRIEKMVFEPVPVEYGTIGIYNGAMYLDFELTIKG